MTVTYDITTAVGQVRLKIGDTDISDYVFTDEELEVFLAEVSNSINLAAALALNAWAAKYTASPDSEHIGDYSYTQKIVDKLLALAKKYQEDEAKTPYMSWSEPDYTSGSGITAEED